MTSGKFSVKARNTTEAYLAILLIIALQVFGLEAGRTQEAVQPGIEKQFGKQEKIYRGQSDDVPSSYVTNRGLSNYAEELPSGFCDALASLGSSDRWLDIGAGQGQAILDYYAADQNAGKTKHCAGSGPRARTVAVSIEDRRTDKWKQQAASLGDDRMRYLSGKHLRQYSREELGKFQIITDVYGGFSYTEKLSQFLETVLSLLDIGGSFYSVLPSVHLEDDTDKLGTWYKTELVDADSRPVKVCSWLKQTTCTKVTCESKTDWNAPTQLIKIEKVCSAVSVPALRVVEYMAGAPPERRFQMVP